jgi:hypothetical protein
MSNSGVPNIPSITFMVPDVPDNFGQLLSECISVLDDLATNLGNYAQGIQDILNTTNNPLSEIVNYSQGEAAQVLGITWSSTLVDGGNAQSALQSAQSCIRDTAAQLQVYQSRVQAGMSALSQVNAMLSSSAQIKGSDGPGVAISDNTISQATRDALQAQLDDLDSTLADIAMTLSAKSHDLMGMSEQIPVACATGFVPGSPIPVFKSTAFSNPTGPAPTGDAKTLAGPPRTGTTTGRRFAHSLSDSQGGSLSLASNYWTRRNVPGSMVKSPTVLPSGIFSGLNLSGGQGFLLSGNLSAGDLQVLPSLAGNPPAGSISGMPGLILASGEQFLSQLPPAGQQAVSFAATTANLVISGQPDYPADDVTAGSLSLAIGATAWEGYRGNGGMEELSENDEQDVTFIDPTTGMTVSISFQRAPDGTVTGTLSDGTQITVTPEINGERSLAVILPDNLGKIVETIPSDGSNIVISVTGPNGQAQTGAVPITS